MKRFAPSVRRAFGVATIALRQLLGAKLQSLAVSFPFLRRVAGQSVTGPRRLRTFFEQAGGAFLKLGQLLALQPDLLPLVYCNELYDLLDRVEASPYEEVAEVFKEEIGRRPEEVFEFFDRVPLSTASIGQVHVGIRDGKKWAVKIRRAGADREFVTDIKFMLALMRMLDFFRLKSLFWLKSPITEFIDWTSEELDYRQEARYQTELRRNVRDHPEVVVPDIAWDLTTRRTLVVEFLDGVTVLDILRALDAKDLAFMRRLDERGYDPAAAGRIIIENFLRDAFSHGIFHADLHPANLFILPGNAIGYVDFGITGALSDATKRHLAALTIAWSHGDLKRICEAFFKLAEATTPQQREAYRSGLNELATDWYETIDGRPQLTRSFTLVMLEMLGLSHRTGIMPDRQVTKYLRSAIATDGLVKRFAPSLDVAQELERGARRYLRSLLLGELFSFETVASWTAVIDRFLPTEEEDEPERVEVPQTTSVWATIRSRPLELAVVSLFFALLGSLTAGPLGPFPGLLAAELALSLTAGGLLAGGLLFQNE